MSLENSIAVLAATPPPPARKKAAWLYSNVGKANARIAELEKALSVPHSKPTFNIGRANHRLEILEAELEEKTLAAAQPPAAAENPPAAAENAPSVTVEKFGRARAIAAMKISGNIQPAAAAPPKTGGYAKFCAAAKVEKSSFATDAIQAAADSEIPAKQLSTDFQETKLTGRALFHAARKIES